MPSHSCKQGRCLVYLDAPGYCAEHKPSAPDPIKAAQQRSYDQHKRDKDSKAFYHSKQWAAARTRCLLNAPTCARCGKWAQAVHHIIPLRQCTAEQRTEQANLMSVCNACHNTIEAEAACT